MTILGDGETPPLLRLIMLRSTVKAWRMLSQKSSSRATVSAGRVATDWAADWARATESTWKAATAPAVELRNRRRCIGIAYAPPRAVVEYWVIVDGYFAHESTGAPAERSG